MPNRLANESSPYLRQHADNPVDWWPWGPEAFAEATRSDKPIFVSIGYAACHWCHVMAHESFEDDEIARLMNERFINIKVDREERPDVDAIFMNAIMVQGEGGGWPLSAFCLPDGRPYFLGTYFPPAPRFGRPSFPQLLAAMSDAYRSQRSDAEDNALALVDGLQRVDAHYRRGARDAQPSALAMSLIVTAGQQLAERSDPRHGGLGGKPKFPSSSTHDLLARAGRLSFGEQAKAAFGEWAKGMAEGGIYDHLGGGFARYSVDEKWLVPHFEKMLYDQAQLLSIYASVVAQGGPFAARANELIAETIAFLERELSDAAGGLWSSLDADSDGEEGKFYVWTLDEVLTQLGKVNGLVFAQAYGVTARGNFEDTPSCVLSRVAPRMSPLEEEQLAEARAKLFEVRAHRNRPGTDDKVLAGWNGLAIAGLVAAWKATGQDRALALALRVATFLRERMLKSDGPIASESIARANDNTTGTASLAEVLGGPMATAAGDSVVIGRVFHQGVTKSLEGTLEDYAFCAIAFFDLAEATGDRAWWDLGKQLVDTARAKFVSDEDGVLVFYLSAAGDSLLVHRPESHQDGAIPSGASWLTMALLRLGLVGGEESALQLAEKYLVQRLGGSVAPNAFANSALFAALDWYLHSKVLVVSAGPEREALIAAARRAYAPTLSIAGPWASASILDGKVSRDGAARAFVCTGPVCAPPVTTAAELVPLITR